MEKVKNYFWKTIDFIYKHKVISFFIAFGIATSFILFNVFADDDQYSNKLVVSNASITAITDGTAPFDAEEGAGKDASGSNGIIRNFDSITYEASYQLGLKEGTLTEPIEGRIVVVDVIIPKKINASVTSPNQPGEGEATVYSLDQNYNYYEFEMDSISTTTSANPNTFSFTLNDVNTQDVTATVSPIVLIKEATDENYKKISDMTDVEKEALVQNLPDNTIACDSNSIRCTTSITGTYDYDVYLYQGTYNGDSTDTLANKTYPIGIGVTIPRRIGIFIPTTVTFNITTSYDDTIMNVNYVDNSFVNYKDSSKNYTIRYNMGDELPNIQNNVSYADGVVTVSNLKYSSTSGAFIGTAAFELNSVRTSESVETDNNIVIQTSNLKIGDTLIKATGGNITVTDYYQKFVGAYNSNLVIYPGTSETYFPGGEAFLNYNEQFRLEYPFVYATDGVGDDLDELDAYIKIDPNAFTISKEGNSIEGDDTAILRYGHGLWTSDYFELTNVAGCPTSFTGLTVENIMNLYGGPCLREKNTVLWNDDETDLPIIIVNGVFGDKDSDELNAPEGLAAKIKLTGKVNNNVGIVNSSHQFSAIATGVFNDQIHYLSDQANYSDVENAKNKDNYKKSIYDFNTGSSEDDVTPCSDYTIDNICYITGETAHIIGYTVNKPEVHSYFSDIERTSFYDYPIEWRIDSNVTSNDDSIEFDSATVTVYVPTSLNYLYAETMINDVRTQKAYTSVSDVTNSDSFFFETGEVIVDIAGLYKQYVFTFTEEEINNGAIDTLSVFTDIYLNTKTGSTAKVLATANFSGYKVDGTNIIRLSDPRLGYLRSSNLEVTLNNGSSVTTYGNATPRYIEKSKSYTYTMKSYNNSSDGTNTGYAYNNATMYYMLPYIEDSNYKTYEKNFTNSSYKVKLTENPAGYTVYYTKDTATNVVSDIYNKTDPDSHTNWTAWSDPTKEVEATAVKIVKNGNWDIDSYFYSENGISVVVTPVKNAQADAYYNGFMVSVDRPEGFTPECDPEQEDCSNITFSPKLYFQSSKSLVEVYSRQLSGFVFEDYNYSDMYENGEDQLENIIVELYRLNNPNYNEESDSTNPNLYVDPSNDELVSTKTTNAFGAYSFTGLEPGYYYVLFRYDGDKYTPSDRYGGLLTGVSNANQINSKAIARNLVENEAVSDIITLSSSASSSVRYINLGLRIRKDFGVEINKYITSIVQTSNQGTKTYEYDKATKVNIDIKNMKNTKFRVTYSFDIVNTKYFPGYIGIIADLMPAGMTFDSSIEENADWTLNDGILYYTGLQNTLLLPGDKQYFQLVLDLDTNKGGTYLNIVAAQQPILMGDDISQVDYSSIIVEADATETNEANEENPTGTNNENSGTQEGNGE